MAMAYHAFMSYSHAADGRLGPALQRALHRFAKPWYRRRALRIFRDKTNLHVTPALWPAIRSALDASQYFILLASPEAAASAWVGREVDYWLQSRPADRLLVVLTGGELGWNPATGAFDPARTTALPLRLMNAFAEEPLYLDLRWARTEEQLSGRHPRFREGVAELAAALHGRDKDDLVGDDVREHRRARRLAAAAVAGLGTLTAIAGVTAVFAVRQRDAAVQQGRIALARQLAAQASSVLTQFPEQLPLAVLLALEGTRLHDSFETNHALRTALAFLPHVVQTQAHEPPDPLRDRVRALAFSPDGALLAAARDNGSATLVAADGTIKLLSHDPTPGAIDAPPGGPFAWKAPGVDAEVTAVVFSRDSRYVATGSNDGTARVWDTVTRREIRTWPHDAPVTSVAFAPDGTRLAVAGRDGVVRVFDVDSGRARYEHAETRDLRSTVFRRGAGGEAVTEEVESSETAEVREVAFSPDGRQLAVLCTDGGISLLDAGTGRRRHVRFAGTSGLALAFSHDGRLLASAHGEVAIIWDADRATERLRVAHGGSSRREGLESWIDHVAFSPDDRYLATGGRDETARIWSVEEGNERVRFVHPAGVHRVEFSPDGLTLATGSVTGARLWDVTSGRERWRLVGAHELVTFSPDGGRIAAAGLDGVVHVADASRGDQPVAIVQPSAVALVGVSGDGTRVATAADDGALRLWSDAGDSLSAATQPVYSPRSLAFSPDGLFLGVVGRNPPLSVVDTRNGVLTPLAEPGALANALASARHVVGTTRESDRVRVWTTAGGGERPSIDTTDVDAVVIDATGTYLALAEDEDEGTSVVRVWDLDAHREVASQSLTRRRRIALSPRARLLAANVDAPAAGRALEHYTELWDLNAGALVARIPQELENPWLSFEVPGRLVTWSAGDSGPHDVRLWDLTSRAPAVRLPHQEPVDLVRFSVEQDAVVTVSGGAAYIWDGSTGGLLSQIADATRINDVAFTPDGRRLITGSDGGLTAVWLWRTGDLREEACRRLRRNLTRGEWQRYLGAAAYEPACSNLPAGNTGP